VTFGHTLIGSYIVQSVLHAFIALMLVEVSFYAWDIKDHFSKFRYRLLTLSFPIVMFPLFQAFNPERGTWYFRLTTALFDSRRWLDIKVIGIYPFGILLIIVLAGFSALFVVQEILPIFRKRGVSKKYDDYPVTGSHDVRMETLLAKICQPLGLEIPAFIVIDEAFPILFTQGFKRHTVIISGHLLETLDDRQLEGALTHEVIHMIRRSSLKTPFIYLLRMLMFYNPVSLVEFRRIVHDDEFICDAITISITKDPEGLIGALGAFYVRSDFADEEDRAGGLAHMKERVESHSHNLMLDERIERLREMQQAGLSKFRWVPFTLTVGVIMGAGYLVV